MSTVIDVDLIFSPLIEVVDDDAGPRVRRDFGSDSADSSATQFTLKVRI